MNSVNNSSYSDIISIKGKIEEKRKKKNSLHRKSGKVIQYHA